MSTYRQFRLGLFCVLGNLLLLNAIVQPVQFTDRLRIVALALVVVAGGLMVEYADRLCDWANRKSEQTEAPRP